MIKKGLTDSQLRFLGRKQVEKINAAAAEVLEHFGFGPASDRILEIFDNGWAEVEPKDRRIRIPQHLVDESLRKAAKQIILRGRSPKYDILLEDSRVCFGTGGTPTAFIRDVETENRRSTKKDFADTTRLGDDLPNMSFIMTIAGAYDVPYEVEYEHEWEALFKNTDKPIVYSAPSATKVYVATACDLSS